MKPGKKLTLAHIEKYKAINQKLNLPDDTKTHEPVKHPRGKRTVYSSDPIESDVPPKIIMVSSIEELNRMMGDTPKNDDHVIYPPALNRGLSMRLAKAGSIDELKSILTPRDHASIKKAMIAYLIGNPKKVRKYVPLINRMNFPTKVAYFASPTDKVISGNVVVKGKAPVIWNYNTIKMKGKATLHIQAPLVIRANNFFSANDSGDKIINIAPADYTSPASSGATGGTGVVGATGAPGVCKPNQSQKGTPMSCIQPPGNGGSGGVGGIGSPGGLGLKGAAQSPFFLDITEAITGNLVIIAGGGDGQDGGTGGAGGTGGTGGIPGANCPPCPPGKPGSQGAGGAGGAGGNGGDGGDGSQVIIYYKSLAGKVIIQRDHGVGGNPGMGGAGGSGITTGRSGNAGVSGASGSKSNIIVEKMT